YWSCSSLGSPMRPPSLGAAGEVCRHELFVEGQIFIGHALERKLPCDRVAAAGALRQRSGDPFGDLCDITTDPPVDAVLDNLRDRAAGEGEDWCSARHRFDQNQPERLFPLDRKEERPGSREQLVLLRGVRFADVLDLAAV